MTDDMMNLRALVEKTPDADLLREMIGFAAERSMEIEVGAATGAGYGEKNLLRTAQRNGYRDRDWKHAPAPSSCAFRSSGGKLFPEFPVAAPHGGKGAHSCHPGSLHPGHLDALGRRSGQGDGHEWRVEKPDVAPVRGDRRQGEGLPRAADRGRLAIPLDRRHLSKGAPRRPHRFRRGHHRRRRQQ